MPENLAYGVQFQIRNQFGKNRPHHIQIAQPLSRTAAPLDNPFHAVHSPIILSQLPETGPAIPKIAHSH